nr:glycosyltransferase family 39 protein [Ardenticatena sp.]
MKRETLIALVAAILLVAYAILLAPLSLTLKSLAVLVLTAYVPGALLVEWLIGGGENRPEWWERILYSIATGYGVAVLLTLLLSYLPGGVQAWQMAVAYTALTALLLWALWRRERPPFTSPTPTDAWPSLWQKADRRWVVAGMVTLFLVGAFFRLPNLGYSEFQGDEARAALRAAGVLQGYEEVLLIHKKGPTEILLPTNVYALSGRLNEAAARLPFAIANIAGLFALFLFGWRLFGPITGWTAAMLLALDGYFIGFSRIVQYQSIVFLTMVLTVFIMYRTTRVATERVRYWVLAALILATGTLSHYEAVVVALPSLLFVGVFLWRREPLIHIVRQLLPALLVGAITLALFYVPFVLHPNFAATYVYLTERRIGGEFPYNNLADFFLRTTVYSTTYYVVLMIGLAVVGLVLAYWRGMGRKALLPSLLLVAGMVVTSLDPTWLTIGGRDYTVLFFTGAFLLAWLMPRMRYEERIVWIWFGAAMILSIFLTEKPRSHVYIFFMPWALLNGLVLERAFHALRARWGVQRAAGLGIALTALAVAVFGTYAYFYFVYNQVEILRTWHENRPPGFWVVYDEPDDKALFGFPLRNGWKVVGTLYAQGVLNDIYETNEKEAWVPDWYTRGQERCLRDHTVFFFIDNLEPEGDEERRLLHEKLQTEYQLFGTVVINGQPRMEIYRKSETPIEPQTFYVEDVEAFFDNTLSAPNFPLDDPTILPVIDHPLNVRLGESIWLKGFSIDRTTAKPGDMLNLTLYWKTTENLFERYTVFNQVIDFEGGKMIGQRDGEPGCDKFPTSKWKPNELVIDRYRIPIFADAPPGTYPLITGMYQREQGYRLEMFSEDGQPLGNYFQLTTITVEAP